MVEMGKKTGGQYFFEPLRTELQDTFGALCHVSPDSVFSSISGLENNQNSLSDEEDETFNDNAEANPPTNEPTPKLEKAKKQNKSKWQ